MYCRNRKVIEEEEEEGEGGEEKAGGERGKGKDGRRNRR